jgi:hypothetical protein
LLIIVKTLASREDHPFHCTNGEGGLDAGQVEKRGCEEEKQDARSPCERQDVYYI